MELIFSHACSQTRPFIIVENLQMHFGTHVMIIGVRLIKKFSCVLLSHRWLLGYSVACNLLLTVFCFNVLFIFLDTVLLIYLFFPCRSMPLFIILSWNIILQGNIQYLEEFVGEWKLSRGLVVFKQITLIGMCILWSFLPWQDERHIVVEIKRLS